MTASSSNGQLATREEVLTTTAGKRRFKGGDDDPGGPLVLPVAKTRVRIRSLMEGEISRWQKQALSTRGRGMIAQKIADANRRLIALCLVDKDGNTLLRGGDAVALSESDGMDTNFLADECNRHCGLDADDLEVLVKNSDETAVVDSPTS